MYNYQTFKRPKDREKYEKNLYLDMYIVHKLKTTFVQKLQNYLLGF